MSRRQAEEALEVDVRDLRLNLRDRLAQESSLPAFSEEGRDSRVGRRTRHAGPGFTARWKVWAAVVRATQLLEVRKKMEQLPKIVRQRLQATDKAGVHPDPDLLTAFAEKSLTEHERVQVLQHLARCTDCRSVVSLAMPEVPRLP